MRRKRTYELAILSIAFILSALLTPRARAAEALYLGFFSVTHVLEPADAIGTAKTHLYTEAGMDPTAVVTLPSLPLVGFLEKGQPFMFGVQFVLLSPERTASFSHRVSALDIWIRLEGETLESFRLPVSHFSFPGFLKSPGLFDSTKVGLSENAKSIFANWGREFTERISSAWEVEILAGVPGWYDETRFILASGVRAKRLLGVELTALSPLDCLAALVGAR